MLMRLWPGLDKHKHSKISSIEEIAMSDIPVKASELIKSIKKGGYKAQVVERLRKELMSLWRNLDH